MRRPAPRRWPSLPRLSPIALLALSALLALFSAGRATAYTVHLKDGSSIVVKKKYVVQGDKAILVLPSGIIPALEPSHALAQVMKLAPTLARDKIIVMNMCGRGDKDIFTVAKHLGVTMTV